MTIITSYSPYTMANLYGQTANNTTTANANSQSASSTAPAGTSSSTTSAAATAAALAAAKNSASYPFATVGQNARTTLDVGLAQYGQTPGSQTTAQQWTQIFGGMDRRSLFAVSSNQGGQFTPQEQQVAQSMMASQLANVGATASSASTQDQLAGYAQKISFLDIVSPEEKQTASWAYSMADAKTSANMINIDSKMPALSSSSSSSLVNVLMGAMSNAQSQASSTINFGTVSNIGQITSQSWAQDYASQIEAAFAATYTPGTSINLSA